MSPDSTSSRRSPARTDYALTVLKVIILAAASSCAWAAQNPMAVCRAIEDAEERVACYDAVLDAQAGITEATVEPDQQPSITESVATPVEVPAVPTAPAEPAAPLPAVSTSPDPVARPPQAPAPAALPGKEDSPAQPTTPDAASNEAEFGRPVERPAKEISKISAAVSEVRRTPIGRLVFELSNGQTWVQTDSRKLNVKQGDTVNIRAGLGGAFFLTKATGSRSLKVRRVN